MGSRTKARECALQALYQLDLSGGDPRDAVRGVLAHFEEADEATERFADELVRGDVVEAEVSPTFAFDDVDVVAEHDRCRKFYRSEVTSRDLGEAETSEHAA